LVLIINDFRGVKATMKNELTMFGISSEESGHPRDSLKPAFAGGEAGTSIELWLLRDYSLVIMVTAENWLLPEEVGFIDRHL
jgi:hypothetical protein